MRAEDMISVVICTYNRSERLRETLSSLARMDIPPDLSWELIVVDNNSDDDTHAVTDQFARSSGLEVRYLFEAQQGLSFARNRGIRESRGEVISFLDDDVIVTEDWLKEVGAAFHRYSPFCMGGKVLPKIGFGKPPWWGDWCEAPLGRFDMGDSVILGGTSYQGMIGTGANLSFCRSAFVKYGVFRTDLGRKGTQLLMGEETELVERIRRAGDLAIYYPQALVYHNPDIERISKRYIRRWYYRGGQWLCWWDLRHGRAARSVFGFPTWRVRSGIEGLVAALFLMLCGRPDKAFRHEIQFVSFVGYTGVFLESRFGRSKLKTDGP